MRICCISDTHSYHRRLVIPECDVLIHAGDLTFRGELDVVRDFASWADSQSVGKIIVVSGNHDWNFAKMRKESEELLRFYDIDYLQDSGITVDGKKFWGSPWQPEFHNWAFNLPRGHELRNKWALIPDDTNVLITHGPPLGILDEVPSGGHVGCRDLAARVQEIPGLKLHVFGHIHHSYGTFTPGRVKYVNAASCTEAYTSDNPPILVEI